MPQFYPPSPLIIQPIRYAPLISSAKPSRYTASSVDAHIEATNLYAKWVPIEGHFLHLLASAVGIRPTGLAMETFLADRDEGSVSFPLIVSRKVPEQDRLTVLIHEILHRIFTSNDMYDPAPGTSQLLRNLRSEFGITTFNTVVHVPIFAMLCLISEKGVIDTGELSRHRARHNENSPYFEAWRYVDECGYARILESMRNIYATLDSAPQRLAA